MQRTTGQKTTGIGAIATFAALVAVLAAPVAVAQTGTPADQPTSGAAGGPQTEALTGQSVPATEGIGDSGVAPTTSVTDPARGPGMDPAMDPATGQDSMATGSTATRSMATGPMDGEDVQVLAELDDPEVASGQGRPSQAQLADIQTKLLNRFSQLGFGEVREFRREGESYVTEALSKDGNWVTVVLDPMSGTIVARR